MIIPSPVIFHLVALLNTKLKHLPHTTNLQKINPHFYSRLKDTISLTIVRNKFQPFGQITNQLLVNQTRNRYTLKCPKRDDNSIKGTCFAFLYELFARPRFGFN
jgi:hypothetical protein